MSQASQMSQVSQSQADEFPAEALPLRVLLFVLEAAEALGVEQSLIAGPCLAALAGCIGNRRRIIINPGSWVEACVLWIAVVLRSGGKKTPALNTVLEHIHEREAAEIEDEKARMAEYAEEMLEWKKAPKDERGEPPEKPEKATRLLVSDVTTEGLLSVHTRGLLGLLLHRDELGGWLRSFNQYKGGGQGGDAQTWSEMHQGRPALIDRKGSGTVSIPRAAVSIVGGIQPELVASTLSGEHLFDGITSRILFIMPIETMKTWTDETISDEAREGWTDVQEELLGLLPDKDGAPIDLPMTEEAKLEWVSYYNAHAQREAQAEGPYRSALSKLEAATARLALVMQLADEPGSLRVGIEAMRAGIAISEWFEEEARRVYQGLEEDDRERERRAVCEWIAKRGGVTTKRQLARHGPNRFRSKADEVLKDLVAEGSLRLSPQLGRCADKYVLATATLATQKG